jgi:hypothetical protein
MNYLAERLIDGIFAASVLSALGLAAITGRRLWAWWQAGQEPRGVRVIVTIEQR